MFLRCLLGFWNCSGRPSSIFCFTFQLTIQINYHIEYKKSNNSSKKESIVQLCGTNCPRNSSPFGSLLRFLELFRQCMCFFLCFIARLIHSELNQNTIPDWMMNVFLNIVSAGGLLVYAGTIRPVASVSYIMKLLIKLMFSLSRIGDLSPLLAILLLLFCS